MVPVTRVLPWRRHTEPRSDELRPLVQAMRDARGKPDIDVVERAYGFAKVAHDGQLRASGEPYITHPLAVATIVARYGADEATICAALLHDTVEDTPVTLEQIEGLFGVRVASLVEQLTDVSRPEDGNRRTRKAIDLAHTATATPEAKTVKLADLISNTRTIVEFDPDFARVYLAEKARLLEVLKEGNASLHAMASMLLVQSRQRLREAASEQ